MRVIKFATILLSIFAIQKLYCDYPNGEWRCEVLTDRTLALTGDYHDYLLQKYNQRYAERVKLKPKARWWEVNFRNDFSGAEAAASFRPALVEALQKSEDTSISSDSEMPLSISNLGYWIRGAGLADFGDPKRLSRNADVTHHIFIELNRQLIDGESVAIKLGTGQVVNFKYVKAEAVSPIFKINQVGYAHTAQTRFAYIGAWLGTAGPLKLMQFDGTNFDIVEASSGKIAYTGQVKFRLQDCKNADGVAFTGEETLEMDLSPFNMPGSYYIRIEGIGRSHIFNISPSSISEAFYVHMKGLYHKRCGIAKEEPYTHWLCPICHETVIRGTFPPNDDHYQKGGDSRKFGFFGRRSNSIQVDHFALIRQNASSWNEKLNLIGGWHDAADHDRRPYHLSIVGNLCSAYLMKPQNFIDGQLNIPESGNGIPDILDEAQWGLQHLLKAQLPNGSVGTWIETTVHPGKNDGLPSEEKLVYYLSRPTLESTMEYCAYAAELALCMRKAGADEIAAKYADSAKRAWEFASDAKNKKTTVYRYSIANIEQTIFYHEIVDLPWHLIFKSAVNMSLLFDDSSYLKYATEHITTKEKDLLITAWKWSPLLLTEMNCFPIELGELEYIRKRWNKYILDDAKEMVLQQKNNYPYRNLWYSPKVYKVTQMSWGYYHPLRRAMTLALANHLENSPEYLEAIFIANDYHNGANPQGITMTSGLGYAYPVRFLDLTSYADGIEEFVPGITPYGNTYGITYEIICEVFGLFYQPRMDQAFNGLSISMLPRKGLSGKECSQEINKMWPIFRRRVNLEIYSVASSEYGTENSAWAAVATGYILEKPELPHKEWIDRKPADSIRKLPGYAPLP